MKEALKKNWGTFLIAGFCLFLVFKFIGVINFLDAKYSIEIKQSGVKIKDLYKDIKKIKKDKKVMDTKIKEKDKLIAQKDIKLQQIVIQKNNLETKYKDILKKYEAMTPDERDKILVETLKKYNINVEIWSENSVYISIEDRGRLLELLVSYEKVRDTNTNNETEIATLYAKITDLDGKVELLNQKISLDTKEISDLNGIIAEKNKIIGTMKKEKTVKFIKRLLLRDVPLVIAGFLIGKYVIK